MKTVVVIFLLALAGLSTAQTNTGAVEGIVRRYGTLEPIPGVQVCVAQGNCTNAIGTTTTDSQGRFSFKNITVGTHVVIARRQGYFGSGSNGRETATAFVPVERQRTTDIGLFMIPEGIVSGRVRLPDARLPSGLQVDAMSIFYDRFGRKQLRLAQSAFTDANGEYRIAGLMPGDYYLRASPGVRPSGFSGLSRPTWPTYFPGTLHLPSSTPVHLRAGSEVVAIDISIQSQAAIGFSVSGTVINTVPETLRSADSTTTIFAVPHEAPIIETVNPYGGLPNLVADKEGRFQFHNLLPGSYDLYAAVRGGNQSGVVAHPTFIGHALISIQDENLEKVAITVRQGVDIRGRLTVNGESPKGRVGNALVGWTPTDALPPTLPYFGDGSSVLNLARVDQETGDFILRNVPAGRYRFNYGTSVPADTYVLDARIGARSVWDEDITIGQTTPGFLEVNVGVSGSIVEGIVTDGQKRAVGGAGVALVPQDRPQAALYKVVTTDKDGRFSIRAIAPGPYKVFAMGIATMDILMDPSFKTKHDAMGVPVSVSTDKKVNTSLTLISQ